MKLIYLLMHGNSVFYGSSENPFWIYFIYFYYFLKIIKEIDLKKKWDEGGFPFSIQTGNEKLAIHRCSKTRFSYPFSDRNAYPFFRREMTAIDGFSFLNVHILKVNL